MSTTDTTLPGALSIAAQRDFVRAVARTLVGVDAVEDVTQTTLLAALEQPPRRPEAMRGWLKTAVRNVASKWRRGEERLKGRERRGATREELPSTGSLVERIELEQQVVQAVLALREPERTTLLLRFYEGLTPTQIALRSGVQSNTVRARLQRGLEELRRRLDASFGGDRGAWRAALLPLALSKAGTTVAAGAAMAGATTIVAGVITMGMKSVATFAAACATAVVAWWVVPDTWIERAFSPVAAGHATRETAAASVAHGTAESTPAIGSADGLDPQREAVGPAEIKGGQDGVPAIVLPPPGRVTLRAVDARTGLPLEAVRIKFLHEERFAEYSGSGDVAASLTSGRWEANVAAVGYEPERLDEFEIHVGKTVELGVVRLTAGSGVIEGTVLARHLAGDQPVLLELFGDGRAPCDLCRETPADDHPFRPCCGYGPEQSQLAVVGDRCFRFTHLGAGVYWLRALDPAQRIVRARRIELGRHGAQWCELDVTAPTEARFELRHENGGLFCGAWKTPHREQPAEISFQFRLDGHDAGSVAFGPERDDVRTSIGGPLFPHGKTAQEKQIQQVEGLFTFTRSVSIQLRSAVMLNRVWSGLEGFAVAGEEERLDRERQEGDGLVFDFGAPEMADIALNVAAQRPDLFRIGPLPREQLTVIVRCGDYQSDELPLDLRFEQFAPLVVTLHANEKLQACLAELAIGAPRACEACHQTQDGNLAQGSYAALSAGHILETGAGLQELAIDSALETGTYEIQLESFFGLPRVQIDGSSADVPKDDG